MLKTIFQSDKNSKLIGLRLLLLLSLSTLYSAQAEDFSELSRLDKLKAAYLFNFTKFIEWPEYDRQIARKSVILCLDADDPGMLFLQALVKNRKVGERKLEVVVQPISPTTRCDMAYLSTPGQEIHDTLQEVLIVSSDTSLFQNVATFSFYEQGKRLRFEIDMQRLNKLDLEISSELLKLARIKQP